MKPIVLLSNVDKQAKSQLLAELKLIENCLQLVSIASSFELKMLERKFYNPKG